MLRPAEMQEQQERGQRGLGVLPSEAQDRPAGAGGIVLNRADFGPLPFPEPNRLADIAPFGDTAVGLDPADVPLAARLTLWSRHQAKLNGLLAGPFLAFSARTVACWEILMRVASELMARPSRSCIFSAWS